MRPAVAAFWEILSDGLAEGAWVGIVLGLIVTLGAWITGEGERARAMRRAAARGLRAPVSRGVFAGVLLLVIWALPLHRFLVAAILVVLASVGFEIARRQTVAELEAGPRRRVRARRRRAPAAAPTQVEELERLARLRSEDSSPTRSTRPRRTACRRRERLRA